MSELRVDNIVSQDGSAAPIYSKGLNIGAGVTLTNNGDYVVGGATSMAGTMQVGGPVTFSSGASVTGDVTVTGTLGVTGGGNFNTTGIITAGTLNVSGATSFGDITGTIATLNVTGNGVVGGALTVTGNLDVNGTTTTIDTATLNVEDRNVGLGSVSTGSPSNTTADGGGITVFGGNDGNKKWLHQIL